MLRIVGNIGHHERRCKPVRSDRNRSKSRGYKGERNKSKNRYSPSPARKKDKQKGRHKSRRTGTPSESSVSSDNFSEASLTTDGSESEGE